MVDETPDQPRSWTAHRFHLGLTGVEPAVWRRFEVESGTSLRELHEVIQAVMGWEGYHLYKFEADGVEYGEPDEDGWLDFADPSVVVSAVAPRRGARLTYFYDFGDDWEHELRVEAIRPLDPDARYPRCLDGARACPPEDCGGVGGYEELLEALRDPDPGEEAAGLIAWAGEDFDPESFDVEEANGRIDDLMRGPVLDPDAEERFEELMARLVAVHRDGDLPVELVSEATEVLYGYALADPRGFLSGRKPEILVAASLHAAGMLLDTPWRGRRPTLQELAERFQVSTASVAERSRTMRTVVARPGPLERLIDAVEDRMAQMGRQLVDFGASPAAMVVAAGFRAPPGPLELDALAEVTGLEERDVGSLKEALRRGMDRERAERGRTDPDHRPLAERLQSDASFGSGLREALRGDDVTPAGRDALARWVLARLASGGPLGPGPLPTSSLLALSHLAEGGMLRGRALASGLSMALGAAPGPAEGLKAEEARPLVRAVGADGELGPMERVALLRDLVERTRWGRDGRQGPALVEMMAADEAVPESVRREVLVHVSGFHDPAPAGHEAGPATRRRALVLRGEMEARPESTIRPLLEAAFDDDVPALAAAELLEAHGAALPADEIESLVREGMRADGAAVRQAFFRAGRSLLGDAVTEWAPDDVLERARREAGASGRRGEDPDQTRLF